METGLKLDFFVDEYLATSIPFDSLISGWIVSTSCKISMANPNLVPVRFLENELGLLGPLPVFRRFSENCIYYKSKH